MSLILLVLIGGIVYAIVNASRGRQDRPGGSPSGAISIRRLFQYLLLLAALIVAASGISGILSQVISDAAARRDTELAGPLALTVTGVPVFWLLGRWIWAQLQHDPAERQSVGWSLYINTALLGSLITGVSLAFAIADGFISGDGYDGTTVAPFLVAVAVWAAHWMVWRRMAPTVMTDLHVMAGAVIGLSTMAGGAGVIIGSAINRSFEQARGIDASAFLSDGIEMAMVAVAIGSTVWIWHWLSNGLQAERTTLWHVYVILFGILGGLTATVIGAARVLYLVMQWVFGDPDATSAAAHFQDASPAFAAAAVGIATWVYHRAVLGRDQVRTDIDRVYDYLVSGVALATVAGALATLIVAFFSLFKSEDAVAAGSSDINIVLMAITLLIVGAPLWAGAWRRAQRALAADPDAEAASAPRRVYLFAVFGVGGAVAFGALIRLVFVVFEAVLGEGSGGGLIDDIEIPIALLATTGAVAAYHWSVYRAEQSTVEPVQWRDVSLIWAGGDTGEIADRAQVRLTVTHRLDVAGAPSPDVIVRAIEETSGDRLLVVAGVDTVEAIPIESR